MLARQVESLIKKYMRLFEQTVADLGEVPKEILSADEPDEGEIVREIGKEVVEPRLERLGDMISDVLGEEYEVGVIEDEEFVLSIRREDKNVEMRVQVVEGEPQLVFFGGEDVRITVSLMPLIERSVVDEGEVLDILLEDKDIIDEVVIVIKDIFGEVEEINVEGEEREGEEIEDKEEEVGGLETEIVDIEGEEEEKVRESLRRRRLGRWLGRRLKEQERGDTVEYEIRKTADAEYKTQQMDFPWEEEGEADKRGIENLTLADFMKKIKPGEGGYPDIMGYVQEPKKQDKKEED